MALNVAQGHLFGTVFEAILYGIYLVLFFLTIFVFNKWKDNRRSQSIILFAMCCMFCLSTAHMGGTIQSLQAGFFDSRPNPPELYFNSKATPLNLANKSVYGTNLVIGDLLMLYRLYIVSSGSIWFILPPSLTLVGTAAATYTTIWEFSELKPGQSAFVYKVKRTAPALFLLSFFTNVLITGSIIFKILQIQRRNRKLFGGAAGGMDWNRSQGQTTSGQMARGEGAGGNESDEEQGVYQDRIGDMVRQGQPLETTSAYRRVIANTIESGVLYPSMLLITTILYLNNSNGQDILTGSMTQIISIVPALMWLQVRLGFSEYDLARRMRDYRSTARDQPDRLGTLRFATGTHYSTSGIDSQPESQRDQLAEKIVVDSLVVPKQMGISLLAESSSTGGSLHQENTAYVV